MVQNPKPEGPVSPKIATAPNQQNKRWIPKDEASASGSEGSLDQIGSRSEASADNNKVKPSAERCPREVAAK
jgi:hypothetical protein